MYRFLIPVLLAGAMAVGCAAPEATAVRPTESPTIDGRLEEDCWQEQPSMTDFSVLDRNTPAAAQTRAWIASDADALYIAIMALEPNPAEIRTAATTRDGAVYNDDAIEILIDAARDRFTFLHFAFNAAGVQFDEAGDAVGADPGWNAPWTVKTSLGPDYWAAEVRLPFAILRLSPDVSGTWGLNVCRHRAADGELSSWSPTGGGFATPQNFGTVQIGSDLTPFMLQMAVTSWGRGAIGHNSASCKLTNQTGASSTVDLALEVKPPAEAPRVTKVPTITLAPEASAEAEPVYQLFEQGRHELTLTATDAGGRLRRAEGLTVDVTALADFMVFKSFYRDDVTVTYTIHAAADLAARCKVRAAMRREGSTEVLAQSELSPDATGGEMSFDTSALPLGDYEIDAALQGPDGEDLVSDTLRFSQLRDPVVGDRVVTVRDDNMLLVEGKPFFPLGIYESPATEKMLAAFAEAGFNLVNIHQVSPPAAIPVLDKLSEYGVKAWLPLSHTLDLSADADARKEKLADYAARIGGHPALLCWESIDEPAWGSQNAEGLYDGYRYLRALDQQRPIWTNHAPRNLISTLAYFNRATDIGGADIYPVPEPQRQSNLPNPTIAVVRDETVKNIQAVNGSKPIFMVLQGFGWKELSKTAEDHQDAVMPTFEQSRFMAYDAIVNGANGVLYWGTHYTKKPSQFFSELKSLISELAVLHDVLAQRAFAQEGAARLDGDPEYVKLLHKGHNGRHFILVVNESPEPVTAGITAPAVGAASLRRLFEGQEVPVRDGRFSLELAGYGVAVLSDDPDIRDVRKDFSAEWQTPRVEVSTEDLYEEGNLLANPGFELDADGDGLPDRWPSQSAFVADSPAGEAHSGERALRITSGYDDFTPLCVQRGIDVQVDKTYELSAWAKTSEPGVQFRIYVEWTTGGRWLSGILPWTEGSGQWQQVSLRFTPQVGSAGSAYCVLQLKGKGSVVFDDVALREVQ